MPFLTHSYRRIHRIALFVVCLLSLSSMVSADSLWSGAWVLRVPPQGGRLIMTVEEVDTGWNLTYQVGQTMGIKKIDPHRTVTVLRFKGKETGVSKAEISPDGKVLKIETDYVSSNPIGKEVQYWDRQ
jgi:hypothetical protein